MWLWQAVYALVCQIKIYIYFLKKTQWEIWAAWARKRNTWVMTGGLGCTKHCVSCLRWCKTQAYAKQAQHQEESLRPQAQANISISEWYRVCDYSMASTTKWVIGNSDIPVVRDIGLDSRVTTYPLFFSWLTSTAMIMDIQNPDSMSPKEWLLLLH